MPEGANRFSKDFTHCNDELSLATRTGFHDHGCRDTAATFDAVFIEKGATQFVPTRPVKLMPQERWKISDTLQVSSTGKEIVVAAEFLWSKRSQPKRPAQRELFEWRATFEKVVPACPYVNIEALSFNRFRPLAPKSA
jgi:hypothetical protein